MRREQLNEKLRYYFFPAAALAGIGSHPVMGIDIGFLEYVFETIAVFNLGYAGGL